ncbi:MAG: hypothetical protein ICV83_32835, partial [Cytophagales bacterium]|nr:hypothetical protein [Cytophagales bacterium]
VLDGTAVNALALHSNTVFVGAGFYLRGIDATTGAVKPWSGKADGKINALLVAGNTLYAAGAFTSINGQGRQRLASFEAATGQLKPWGPAADGEVTALAAGNGLLYVGGRFTTISSLARNRLAAVDEGTGAVAAWSPLFEKTVASLALVNNILYAGTESEFSESVRMNTSHLCTVHTATGEVAVWESFPLGRPLAIAAYPGIVYVGGDLEAYRGWAAGAFAALGKYTSPPNLVKGNIYEDHNGNCTRDEGEKGMAYRVVVARPGNYFSSTDSLGNYSLAVDSGSYTLQQIIPADQAGQVTQLCPADPATHSVRFNDAGTGMVAGKNFANRVVVAPRLSIQVASDRRRRCFPGRTVVVYGNSGDQAAPDVKIYVKLPEHVRLVSADAVYQRAEDHTYIFTIGALPAGASGRILIKDSVVCNNPAIRGLTQCTEAWITPANPRTPAAQWDRSNVQVRGVCTSTGKVRLGLYNQGTEDMADSSSFRVYLDAQLAFHKKYKLSRGDSLILLVPASGQTVRLEADQRPGHPTKTSTNVTLEACGTHADGTVSKGFVTQFAQDDPEPEVAVECLPITDSYDPNDKLVAPAGVTDKKFTPTQATLHYTIRFQNTGTDVAYRVVVVDTLSEHLDLGSLQLGAASHPYALRVSGKGRPVLTFTFDPINLPDSTRDK